MSQTPRNSSSPALRRRFLKATGSTAVAGAALAAPALSRAQTTTSLRFQSTWPSKDIFHEYALDFAKRVNDMTGGELKIEVLPAGAVVPAFGLFEAVSKGTLDGGHGILGYHYGKQNALALWNSGPMFGMDATMLMAWHRYGGGKELLAKLYASIGGNVVSYLCGPMTTQPLGWFKKPITKPEDFKGLKFRTNGLAIDLFTAMGAAVNALPGGEIVPAMDRGLLDGAEFNNASSDRILGFPDVSKVCMLQSYHQSAETFEISFNKTKFDALPAKMKAIIDNAVDSSSSDVAWKAIDLFTAMGAAVNALPGGEIVPAMDRGLLDGAEFNNASSDRILGFPDVSKVCMLQSYHQSAETFEISFNKTKFDALPAKMKAIIDNAVDSSSSDVAWKAIDRYSKDYIEMQTKDKVRFYKTPDSVLQAQLNVWNTILEKKSAENPMFKEIAESQRAFAERAVKWDQDTNISRRMSVNHFFGPKAAPKKA